LTGDECAPEAAVTIRVGVDTLCWHAQLEQRELGIEDVFDQATILGAECVSVGLHHLRHFDREGRRALGRLADELGLAVIVMGDSVGAARDGGSSREGAQLVADSLAKAEDLGSSLLRLTSSFYRADFARRPDLIRLEQQYITDVLKHSLRQADAVGISLLLENHSDFTAMEYEQILDQVGHEHVGVFLDLTNPVSALDDPVPFVERMAPHARAGHIKDYLFRSILCEDGHHRYGFEVRFAYPGEGVADLPRLVAALKSGVGERDYQLTIEGLVSRAGVSDQLDRLRPALAHVRDMLDVLPEAADAMP
jgi:3-oxoisoapionate decarboxylase